MPSAFAHAAVGATFSLALPRAARRAWLALVLAGLAASPDLGKYLPAWQQWAGKYLGWMFMKDIPEGAATTCYVATSPDLVGVRGFYFADCNVKLSGADKTSPYLYDREMASKLWTVSEEITGDYLRPWAADKGVES